MARLNSFYIPTEDWPAQIGDMTELTGSEARHMLTVLRTTSDETVRLFDGHGREGLFQVRDTAKNRAMLEAVELKHHPQPKSGVTLAIAWGKSKRRNYLFEKIVELKGLGVIFWDAKRSQGNTPTEAKDTWFEKCVQAAKQCGNPFLPSLVTLPGGIDSLLEVANNYDSCYLAWESDEANTVLTASHFKGKCLVVIGPEGGIEDVEAQRLIDGGFAPITLGDTIMRWETAATYCLSLAWLAQQEIK